MRPSPRRSAAQAAPTLSEQMLAGRQARSCKQLPASNQGVERTRQSATGAPRTLVRPQRLVGKDRWQVSLPTRALHPLGAWQVRATKSMALNFGVLPRPALECPLRHTCRGTKALLDARRCRPRAGALDAPPGNPASTNPLATPALASPAPAAHTTRRVGRVPPPRPSPLRSENRAGWHGAPFAFPCSLSQRQRLFTRHKRRTDVALARTKAPAGLRRPAASRPLPPRFHPILLSPPPPTSHLLPPAPVPSTPPARRSAQSPSPASRPRRASCRP